MVSIKTDLVEALSFDNLLFLKKGTSAPYFFEIFAIFSQSVLTIILENIFDFCAALIE